MSALLMVFVILYFICLCLGVAIVIKNWGDHEDETILEKIIFYIVFLTPINILFFPVGLIYEKFEDEINFVINKIKTKIKEIKRRRLYLKYKDIDPYGEEDWTIK